MADPLYLNLWFPSFTEAEMLPHFLCVLKQFPFARSRPGLRQLAVMSVSWNEAPVFEESFESYASPEHAVELASEFLHDDSAYVVEAAWDLWMPGGPGDGNKWREQPVAVKIIAHGPSFDEAMCEQSGHVQIELGLDTPFLFEDEALTPETGGRIKVNIEKLVALTTVLEKNCGVYQRLLWSESDDNLARKLIARLQKLN